MLKQKCKITALLLALVFAVFVCPLGIQQAQAKNIDSGFYGTEALTDTVNPGDEPDPEPTEPPPTSEIEPTEEPSDPESSFFEETPAPTEDPNWEPDPTQAPTQAPTWAPDPTQAPNYEGGATATATPRPTASPSSSSSTAGITRPTATLKPNTGSAESSASTQKESNYVTFATMNIRQNSFATSLFYGGVACIALGSVGIITLIVLFIRNRRFRKNDRDGIFEEIEQAEIRGKAAQEQQMASINTRTLQGQQSGQMSRTAVKQPAREQSLRHTDAGPPAVKPDNISMYTEEIQLPASRQTTGQPPAAPRQTPPPAKASETSPKAGGRQFDTEEILREALRDDDTF